MAGNNRGGYEYDNSHRQMSKNMKVEWLLSCNFPYKEIEDFPGNPLNDHMPIGKSYNGQELPYNLGNYLSHLMLKKGLESQEDLNGQPSEPEFPENDKFQRILLKAPESLQPLEDGETESVDQSTE